MKNALPLLLQPDRAARVFTLLFSFVRDDACTDEDVNGFECTVREILGRALVPQETYTRLRAIYEETMHRPDPFAQAVTEAAQEFADQREILVLIVRIMLRISQDDGMAFRRDTGRMSLVLREFNLDLAELESLDREERDRLDYLSEGEVLTCDEELIEHYRVLGCAPGSSDREVQQSYRRLVMQHHPDRQAPDAAPHEAQAANRQFRRVQKAYEAIRSTRRAARL